jgi:acetyltransferase
MPELSDDTRDSLSELLPGITYTGNPVDTGRPMPRFGEVVRAVAEDDAVDLVLVYELFEEALDFPVDELDELAEEVDKPVLFATDGPDTDMAEQIAALQDAGVPVYRSPERAADAAALVARYADLSAEEVAADA